MSRNLLLVFLVTWCASIGYSQSSMSIVQDKNFYLLSSLQQHAEVADLLVNDKAFSSLKAEKLRQVNEARTTCKQVSCQLEAFLWTEQEIEKVSELLKKKASRSKEIRQWVLQDLRPANAYALWSDLSDEELLVKSWELCARGMNHVIEVYGNGKSPNYPNIDSITYQLSDRSFQATLKMWVQEIASEGEHAKLFFEPTLDLALSMLYINHRDEAARYEPMQSLENAAAIEYIQTINWEEYPYASILVLGAGSEIYGVTLTPNGKLNLRLAVRQYQQGLAPLIIVSGGHVHPFRTPSCEAIEMKKELMNNYRIPENHIIIEPHARHTTTNLRNASRLLFQYGVPDEKTSLVTTNFDHSDYVGSQRFLTRCQDELGYLPMTLLKRVSDFSIEFLPNFVSFHQNPLEPLDP